MSTNKIETFKVHPELKYKNVNKINSGKNLLLY